MRQPLSLVHAPTPLVPHASLSRELGMDLWIKRDDVTGGVEAGNKLRKLEHLFADALSRGADAVITCGALQSNHCRATVVVARMLGLAPTVLLRAPTRDTPVPTSGNAFLMKLAGADIRVITPPEYQRRNELMKGVAAELTAAGRRPYVIPEGGSNGLGALGYVTAMREVAAQLLARNERPFDVVVHACGSGGTAAGVALGAALTGCAKRVVPVAVCDDVAYFTRTILHILDEARTIEPSLPTDAPFDVDDRWKGRAYGVATDEQKRFFVHVARAHGLFVDPVYTGKALFAVARREDFVGKRVLFLHTGGLPGLLAEGDAMAEVI